MTDRKYRRHPKNTMNPVEHADTRPQTGPLSPTPAARTRRRALSAETGEAQS
jgi:hypothetical protein